MDWIVEISDEWSGATLRVTADNPAMACAVAMKQFARDRKRPLDLDTLRLKADPRERPPLPAKCPHCGGTNIYAEARTCGDCYWDADDELHVVD